MAATAPVLRARSLTLCGALRRRFIRESGRGARGFSTNQPTGGGSAANSGGPANGRGAKVGGAASGGGAPANGGGGAVTGSGNGAATNGGGPVNEGWGLGNGGGWVGGYGCPEVKELRKDFYVEVGRVWGGYNNMAAAHESLLEQIAALQMECAVNQVKSNKELVNTIYKMLGSAAAFTLLAGSCVGQYMHNSIVHEAAKEVHSMVQQGKLNKVGATKAVEGTKAAATPAAAAAAPNDKAEGKADGPK